ncbi:MAG TPA: class I SAM-dependent methyltransferase [Rhizomicrobium sp.]|nr:class I SAM-dependent methyltransferase [Rhizomicrobium sp.]
MPSAGFFSAYARHRAAEGRAMSPDVVRTLPYLCQGPLARQWRVRAKTYEAFIRRVVKPMAAGRDAPLQILDLGAGNGWLCHRLRGLGHELVAVDVRDDTIDGLGIAAALSAEEPVPFACVTASFEALPLAPGHFDIVVFNASLHYAQNLSRALGEAMRVTSSSGVIAIMDSPFYRHPGDGEAMVAEKRAQGFVRFGTAAPVLLAPQFIEYLTRESLAAASPSLCWRRHRVRYPLWYEMRPLLARLGGRRAPSRFDLWTARVP